MNNQKNQNTDQTRKENEEIFALLQKTRQTSFSPFFAEKVVNRIVAQKKQSFEQSMLWSFKRLVWAGAFAVLVLLALNLWNGASVTQTNYDLSDVTIEDAVITSFAASLEDVL